jgi:hypothetical protein
LQSRRTAKTAGFDENRPRGARPEQADAFVADINRALDERDKKRTIASENEKDGEQSISQGGIAA